MISVDKLCIVWINGLFTLFGKGINLYTPVDKFINVNKCMLTERLKCIASLVKCDTAADIGTDHAYIPIELVKSERAKKVIASDVREGPIKIAAANISKYGLTDKIETRLGSGLSVLKKGEADNIIIAGMGGELICEIIKKDTETARAAKLILQPMNYQYELRKYLIENDFTIETEDIACEGHRVYNILVVKNGRQKKYENDIEYHFPTFLLKNKNFKFLYEKKEREFKKIITGIEISKNYDKEKLNYYKECLEQLKKYRKDLTEKW